MDFIEVPSLKSSVKAVPSSSKVQAEDLRASPVCQSKEGTVVISTSSSQHLGTPQQKGLTVGGSLHHWKKIARGENFRQPQHQTPQILPEKRGSKDIAREDSNPAHLKREKRYASISQDFPDLLAAAIEQPRQHQ